VTSSIGSIANVLERAGAAPAQPAFTAPEPIAATPSRNGVANNSWMGGAVLGAGFVLLGGIATAIVMRSTAPAPTTITTLSPITTAPKAPQPLPPPPTDVAGDDAVAKEKELAKKAEPPVPAAALSRASIASLQAGLLQLGYETGPIDGVVGPRTSAAIKAFQYAEHLHVDGTLSAPTRAVLQRRIGEP
jgi:Putative peptidoglycan binding domain